MQREVTLGRSSLCYTRDPADPRPPILCLHGLNLRKEIFLTRRMRRLLREYSPILIDLCGYGRSRAGDPFTMGRFDALLQALMAQEGLKHAALCGYCLGGVFALDYAIRHPEQADRVILLETMTHLPRWMWVTSLPGYAAGYDLFQRQTAVLRLLGQVPAFAHMDDPQRIALSDSRWKTEINTRYLALMERYQHRDHLRRSLVLNCPVDLYYSDRSFGAVRRTAREFSANPAVRLHRVPGGHFLYLDESHRNTQLLPKLFGENA